MSERRAIDEATIRVVRLGSGANCSSIGSVIDTIFATAAVGGAVFAGIVAALAREDVRVVGEKKAQVEAKAPSEKDE